LEIVSHAMVAAKLVDTKIENTYTPKRIE
jgi:hypothetical protein